MAPSPTIVYSRRYNFGLPGMARLHPFDLRKFARARRLLLRSGAARRRGFARPLWPSDSQLAQVHWRKYLKSVRSSETLARIVEVPLVGKLPSPLARYALLTPMRWAVGGTMLASAVALKRGEAINLGGGFHHARAGGGHGFCIYSDVAVAIAGLRASQSANRFLIVDLDAHQGDGHAHLFMQDDDVRILDMYNCLILPGDQDARAGIEWEVRLRSGTGDDEYLSRLEGVLPSALDEFRPDLAFYLAGTDVVQGDPLGLLNLTPEGVLKRDLFVWEQFAKRNIPRVLLTAGGYTAASAGLIAATVEHLLPHSGSP